MQGSGDRLETEVIEFSLVNAAVGASMEIIGAPVRLWGLYDDLVATVQNTGGNDLTGLRVDIALNKADYDAALWHIFIEDTADWVSSSVSIKEWVGLPGAQTDISLLATVTNGGLWLHFPKPIHAFRIFASSSGTALTINGECKRRQ